MLTAVDKKKQPAFFEKSCWPIDRSGTVGRIVAGKQVDVNRVKSPWLNWSMVIKFEAPMPERQSLTSFVYSEQNCSTFSIEWLILPRPSGAGSWPSPSDEDHRGHHDAKCYGSPTSSRPRYPALLCTRKLYRRRR